MERENFRVVTCNIQLILLSQRGEFGRKDIVKKPESRGLSIWHYKTSLYLDQPGAVVQGDGDHRLGAQGGEGQRQDPACLSTWAVYLVPDFCQEERYRCVRATEGIAFSHGTKKRFSNLHPEARVTLNANILTLIVHLELNIRLVDVVDNPLGVFLLVEGVGKDEGVNPGLDARARGGWGEEALAAWAKEGGVQGCTSHSPNGQGGGGQGEGGGVQPTGPDQVWSRFGHHCGDVWRANTQSITQLN